MDTIAAGKARTKLYRLIDVVAELHGPVKLTGRRSSAILVSEEDWKAIQETMYLLAVPGMRKSIKHGMAVPLSKKKTLKW